MYTIELFKNVAVDEKTKLKAIEFLNRYKSGHFIYPGVIIRNLKLPKDAISWIIQALVENDLVEEMKYGRCPICCSSTDAYSKEEYAKLEELECYVCNNEINLEQCELVYKLK